MIDTDKTDDAVRAWIDDVLATAPPLNAREARAVVAILRRAVQAGVAV